MLLSDADIQAALSLGRISITSMTPSAIQPASIDVTLGCEFRVPKPRGIIDTRSPGETTIPHVVDPGGSFIITPGQMVLATTMESVTLDRWHAGTLEGRSSLGRLGLEVHRSAGIIDPGFSGQITLELTNANESPLRLWPGDRIAQLLVWRMCSPSARPYGSDGVGRYQGQCGPTPSLGTGGA